jgi:hypothetical protein
VDRNPKPIVVVAVEVHVVIPAADRTELLCGKRVEPSLWLELCMGNALEHWMIDRRFAFPSNPKRNSTDDLIHHARDVNICGTKIGANGFVAAGDVEPYTRERDFVPICNCTTDWMSITVVGIGVENANVVGTNTPLELLDCSTVDDVLSENGY